MKNRRKGKGHSGNFTSDQSEWLLDYLTILYGV